MQINQPTPNEYFSHQIKAWTLLYIIKTQNLIETLEWVGQRVGQTFWRFLLCRDDFDEARLFERGDQTDF